MLHLQANLFIPYASVNELRHARLEGTIQELYLLHNDNFFHERGEERFLVLSGFPEGTCLCNV